MGKIIKSFSGEEVKIRKSSGDELLYNIFIKTDFRNIIIEDMLFENVTNMYIIGMRNVEFRNCEFKNCDFSNVQFFGCKMKKCKFTEGTDLSTKTGVEIDNVKKKPITKPTNEEIEARYHCKVIALPNKSFVKVKWTCDFCHKEWFEIYRRDRVEQKLYEVPNCGKQVCSECNSVYSLRDKFQGNRIYGYHGTVHKYKTPIDAENTAIIGLEMEFEGDFYGWKELQDAHQGMLHYGYDSSVIGQNELSWDCGSYSWWKYLAPLKNVCDVLGKYGGHAGDSAGIHIHVSRPDKDVGGITSLVNTFGMSPEGKTLFEAVSLRNNREKFETYSNLSCDMGKHHAGISYNSYGTCEFRLFNSSLDYKLILKHIKFCKEVFNAFAENKNVWKAFSKETITHIKECAKIQLDKGFISSGQYDLLISNLG